jgi:hypothetical protein
VVDGVGLVEFAVPPLGVVYQFKRQFKDGIADSGLRFHFDNIKWDLWRYTISGETGNGFTVVQPLSL